MRKFVRSAAVFWASLAAVWRPLNATPKSVTVFFRYDDYSARSDTSLERRLFDLFRRLGLRLTVAAIPAVCAGDVHDYHPQQHMLLAGEKARLLREVAAEGIAEVALHGYSHQTVADLPEGSYSEFRGLTLEQARERIRKGKEILETAIGAPVVIFVPPWNSYDPATERALEELGFQCLSASHGKATSMRLRYVPVTAGLDTLKAAIARAREGRAPGTIVGVLFHDFEFVGLGFRRHVPGALRRHAIPWETFERDLEWLVREPDIRISSVGELLRTGGDFGPTRLMLNQPQWLVPPPWNSRTDRLVYLSSHAAATRRRQGVLAATLYYPVLATFGVGAGLFLALALPRRLLPLYRLACWAIPLLMVARGVYYAYTGGIGWRGASALALLAGTAVGLWLAPKIFMRPARTAAAGV